MKCSQCGREVETPVTIMSGYSNITRVICLACLKEVTRRRRQMGEGIYVRGTD